jgi:alpha-galactosidase
MLEASRPLWVHAASPPMGWNTWDCYGSRITESEVKENARYLAERLRPFGWEYVVIDINWCEPTMQFTDPLSEDVRDEYGRYVPATNRFPSAAGGKGFRPLADYLHSLGLKFGLHMLRGIPRRAVELRERVRGTPYTADQIADRERVSTWNHNNYGVATDHPGGQAYYDSLIELYASWGVDFLKADDMVVQAEIDALADAIARFAPEMVLSLVGTAGGGALRHPGATMFRISTDLWDEWHDPTTWWVGLNDMFELCAAFAPHLTEGHYPDPDMMPLGRIGKHDAVGVDRQTRLTPEEQVTLMNLWCISRAPLMFGGSLVEMDPFTLSLLTNREALAVNQHSCESRPLYTEAARAAWTARDCVSGDICLALFNRYEEPATVEVDLEPLGLGGELVGRDLWTQVEEGLRGGRVARALPAHGSALLRITARQ